MSTFQTASAVLQPLDPLKRMNYTFGLVLGVDEFQQEQAYFLAKARTQNRILHGYGTAYGLEISTDSEGTPNVEVRVSCGVAYNPKGQEIHVPRTMCAPLNDWLTKYEAALDGIYGDPPLTLSVCVVLCYRECQTDQVPVPGEPCRTQEDAMAPSHIADSFELKICLDTTTLPLSPPVSASSLPAGLCLRPLQVEEEAARSFQQLIARMQVSSTASPADYLTQDELDTLVLQLASPGTLASPPSSGPLWVRPLDATDFVRRAFLLWITQVRPALNGSAQGNCCAPDENCVLLARLTFAIGNNWMVLGDVTIDETDRPFLVQTRLLQEAAIGSAISGGTGQAGVVAAGTFQITGALIGPVGPTLNGLTATSAGTPGNYLLSWTGSQPYINPLSSPPAGFAYVVKGAAYNSPANKQQIFEVVAFKPTGIVVRVLDPTGAVLAGGGFMVEISQIASAS